MALLLFWRAKRCAAVAKRTKRTIEADIADAVVLFQREQHGRGSSEVRVQILGDLVLVRSTGILTLTESRLSGTEEGRRLVWSARHELRHIAQPESEAIIARIVGCSILRSYGDVNVLASEQMEVYVLDGDLERRLLRQELDALSGMATKREQ